MKYNELRRELDRSNIEGSDLDWAFCEVLGLKRSQLASEIDISKKQERQIRTYAKKLVQGVPLSQVLGYSEFMGLKVLVNRDVLSPRSETEELADMLVREVNSNPKPNKAVLDLCTGSGAIAMAVKAHTNAEVTASDVSTRALKVAKKNIKAQKLNITLVKSDMLADVWGLFDYIVCNPPYIAFGDKAVDESVERFEPHLALYADDGGYKYYKILAKEAKYYLHRGGKIFLEVGINMAQKVAELFSGYHHVEIKKDMQGIERFVIISK
ncbi:MAG: peptide chain release factor N(5)-glutamine methyltransferase [Clostridia bacterium]|nr:peptide chain release factor N(5)-glutamine methyltransferase [Clostridia bacterium]